MNWNKKSSLSPEEVSLNKKIKTLVKNSPFFKQLFMTFNVPLDRIDNSLDIRIVPLNGKNAKSNGKVIFINKKLYDRGDFIPNCLHFIVHELIHWLTRHREKDCYFTDPEEIQAFTMGMVWEILRGKGKEEIFKVYFPIIRAHFNNDEQALQLCEKFFAHAEEIKNDFV